MSHNHKDVPDGHEERVGYLEASRLIAQGAHDREMQRIARERQQADAKHAAEVHACEVAVRERARQLDADLAAEITKELAPLFATIAKADVGRRTAVAQLALVYCALDARAVHEQGEHIDFRHLGIAIAAAHGLADALGHPDFFSHAVLDNAAAVAVENLRRGLLDGVNIVALENMVIAAEAAICARVAAPSFRNASFANNTSAMKSSCTRVGIQRALGAAPPEPDPPGPMQEIKIASAPARVHETIVSGSHVFGSLSAPRP